MHTEQQEDYGREVPTGMGGTRKVPFKPGELVSLKHVAFEVVMCDVVDGQGVLLLRAQGIEGGPIPNRHERRKATRIARGATK